MAPPAPISNLFFEGEKMLLRRIFLWSVAFIFIAMDCEAGIFGTVRGIVHDPQHRPIAGARVTLRAQHSEWRQQAETNSDGEFAIGAVPLGEYTIRVERAGFRAAERDLTVASGSAPVLHFPMELEAVRETIEVTASAGEVNPESATTQGAVHRGQIERTPGASRTNSLEMITNYVPGAYLVHNQLHLRGGHQITWLVDGVAVPNTNIAGNVGPQFDPKDIDTVEVQRGGLSAEYGDRAYAIFNVVTRSGFERNREAEIILNYGSFHETNSQMNFGSHTSRFAYYASVSGNRTDLGLQTPVPETIHDQGSGLGGFVSLIFNASAADQLRWVAALRRDEYQIPNSPSDQAAGIRDLQRERDAFLNFTWLRTFGKGVVLSVSPFYHFNRAVFEGGPNDSPVVATDHRSSHYAGGQVALSAVAGRHNARLGVHGWAQLDRAQFGLQSSGGGLALTQSEKPRGHFEAFYLEDQYKLTEWLSVSGGFRATHFSAGLEENAVSPRVGVAVQLPRLGWVLRGSYSRVYQPPPLSTVSGPLLQLALSQGFGFLPLRGERDEQIEAGVAIPVHGWVLDTSLFRTRARNFFDHDVLSNSNIFFPLTIDTARIRGGEITLRSPRMRRRAQFHLAFSHQFAQGQGGVSGGLTDFSPPGPEFFFLDHDQRNTLSAGIEVALPSRSWFSSTMHFGSGFLDADGPDHLAPHTTWSFAVGKSVGEAWTLSFTALNVANARYLMDNSNTFGGTHFSPPRQFFGEVRYRFHF
jgi:hypothetical protein